MGSCVMCCSSFRWSSWRRRRSYLHQPRGQRRLTLGQGKADMALILAALLGVFISLVGVWFITSPFNAVQAFGIDPSHMADIAPAPGFGVRDVALGLIIIGFALARKPGAAGTALLVTSMVPIGDFVIAGKAFGYAAAVRHLITLPFLLILGLILVRK